MESAMIDVQSRQRVEALARANRVRMARAELKRRIAGGHVSAAEVILFQEWEVETMPVADVLMSQRYWGDTRCRRLLLAMGLSASKPIGSMTERQRLAMAERLVPPTGSKRTGPGSEQNGGPQ